MINRALPTWRLHSSAESVFISVYLWLRTSASLRLGGSNKAMSEEAIEAKLARLAELENRFAEAVERAKLEAMKELAYGAGHEINNPLANIASRAQTLLQEETDPEKRRKLAAINAQAFRAHEMIADLMLFARPPQLRPEPVDLSRLVEQAVAELNAEAEDRRCELQFQSVERPVSVTADPTQLHVVIRALVTNSLEALGSGGRIDVRVAPVQPAALETKNYATPRPQKLAAELIVADNGPSIPREIRSKIFDPFFSGREAGRGLGFGLSKCWRIVTLHGGTIEVRETPGGGATLVITLPCASLP